MTPQEFQVEFQKLMQGHSAAMMAIQKTYQEALQKENTDFQTKLAALQAQMVPTPPSPPVPPGPGPMPVPPCPTPPVPPMPMPKTSGKKEPAKKTKDKKIGK